MVLLILLVCLWTIVNLILSYNNLLFKYLERLEFLRGQNNERISSPLVHHLGVISAGLANRPRYAVEINTRSVLNEAPLHGAVWRLVEMFNSDEKETLLRFVDEELCYFKGEAESSAWISCKYYFFIILLLFLFIHLI